MVTLSFGPAMLVLAAGTRPVGAQREKLSQRR